jgi:hypothetical protein
MPVAQVLLVARLLPLLAAGEDVLPAGATSTTAPTEFSLLHDFSGDKFFDAERGGFEFYTDKDPTDGTVDFVGAAEGEFSQG